jgi:hypothetical protein
MLIQPVSPSIGAALDHRKHCNNFVGHMEADRLSLRDLIETTAAASGMSLRVLWSSALAAIMRDELVPVLPDGVSLDAQFESGGRRITLRQVITSALDRIQYYNPSEYTWAKSLMFDGVAFNNWFEQNRTQPPRPPRRRPPPYAFARWLNVIVKRKRNRAAIRQSIGCGDM